MNNMAYFLAATGDNLDEALQLAKAATAKMPQEPNFADTLAYIYMKRDQNDDAIEIFNKLVSAFPHEPSFTYHLGLTWYQKGDRTKAKSLLARALQLNPPKDTENEIRDILARLN
jgi:Flp pilus assembly protein TadD